MITPTTPLMHYGLIALSIVLLIAFGRRTYLLLRRSLTALVRTRHLSEPFFRRPSPRDLTAPEQV